MDASLGVGEKKTPARDFSESGLDEEKACRLFSEAGLEEEKAYSLFLGSRSGGRKSPQAFSRKQVWRKKKHAGFFSEAGQRRSGRIKVMQELSRKQVEASLEDDNSCMSFLGRKPGGGGGG